MNHHSKTLWLTRTAVFTALIIALQAATAGLGNPIVTGSIVNLLLVTSVMTCGLSSGLIVAALSPFAAKVIGIGPLWSLIPLIAAGNIVLVLLWYFIGNGRINGKQYPAYITALFAAAAAKFLVLYLGIVKVAVPFLLHLPEQQAAVISNMFSLPQLITALVGGAVALILFPRLKKAIAGGRG